MYDILVCPDLFKEFLFNRVLHGKLISIFSGPELS